MKEGPKVLHTSDWHLGQSLCGRRRYDEFAAFLNWLLKSIEENRVDVLLVAGDVFDTGTPPARAQGLYYDFLGRLAAARLCRQVVIISGNHDSPLFLSAPAQILKSLNIHIASSADINEEIVAVRDDDGDLRLVVAAVPYPRDREFRESLAGESAEEKEQKLTGAIAAHYAQAAEAALRLVSDMPQRPPILAMGHLFAAGGETAPDDIARDLYVGTLGRVPGAAFPAVFDYVALGHLHLPQIVAGDPTRRYSGAPLAMSFGEAARLKSVTLLDFGGPGVAPEITAIPVPVFQPLCRVSGDWAAISASMDELVKLDKNIWLEVEYLGGEIVPDLRERLFSLTDGSRLEILRVKNPRLASLAMEGLAGGIQLSDLDEAEVFQRCLDQHGVTDNERPGLWAAYNEAVYSLGEGA